MIKLTAANKRWHNKQKDKERNETKYSFWSVLTTVHSRQCNWTWHMAQLVISNTGATAVFFIPGDTIRG